ncbi:MAG TPA: hypothetical protein VJQ44_14210 [Gemmatimonadales bacterium]|nr:hypothetical protein [Gemmatimonadales bacterium]
MVGTDGRDLPFDAHALTAYAECRRDLGQDWQVAGGLRAYAWRSPGAEDLHDLEGSVRLAHAPPGDALLVFLDASWTTSYRRAVLQVERPMCDSPLGPCRKVGAGPVMQSDRGSVGPGGPEVFADRSGRRRMAYHAWSAGAVGYGRGGARSLRLERVILGAAGE